MIFGYFRLKFQFWAVLRMRGQIPTRDQPWVYSHVPRRFSKYSENRDYQKIWGSQRTGKRTFGSLPPWKLPVLLRFKIRWFSEILKDNFVLKNFKTKILKNYKKIIFAGVSSASGWARNFNPQKKKQKRENKKGKKNPRGRRGRNTLGDEEVA